MLQNFTPFKAFVPRCLNGQCGTFAYLLQQHFGGELVLLGDFWDYAPPKHGQPKERRPRRLRRDYFFHVLVRCEGRYFDARGERDLSELAIEFDSNGLAVVSPERLRRAIGSSDRHPLTPDPALEAELAALFGQLAKAS